MLEHIPTLGARFDLNKIGTEQNCWQVFWRAVRPEQIPGASLYEGSIHRDDYCIALQSTDPALVDFVRHSLDVCREFREVCCAEPFIDGDACASIELPRTGRIDANGNLIGDDKRTTEAALQPVGIDETFETIDVLRSASFLREIPASERTRDLPEIASFEDFVQFFKDRFVFQQPGFDREIWLSPKELCDVVEMYAPMLEIGLSQHHMDRSENALRVRIFGVGRPDLDPVELEGLYMFKSRFAVTQFLQSFVSTPRYADALPDLAGIVGRFHLHFGQPRPNAATPDYSQEDRISPSELWPRLHAVIESFGEELTRAAETLNRRRMIEESPLLQPAAPQEESEPEPEPVVIDPEILEAKRKEREARQRAEEEELAKRRAEIELEAATQEIRRTQQRCIFCGKPLGFSEKLKKVDRHKDCWEYVGE